MKVRGGVLPGCGARKGPARVDIRITICGLAVLLVNLLGVASRGARASQARRLCGRQLRMYLSSPLVAQRSRKAWGSHGQAARAGAGLSACTPGAAAQLLGAACRQGRHPPRGLGPAESSEVGSPSALEQRSAACMLRTVPHPCFPSPGLCSAAGPGWRRCAAAGCDGSGGALLAGAGWGPAQRAFRGAPGPLPPPRCVRVCEYNKCREPLGPFSFLALPAGCRPSRGCQYPPPSLGPSLLPNRCRLSISPCRHLNS